MANNTQDYHDDSDDAEFEDGGSTTLVEEKESPFKYYVEGERLREDGAYFELLLYRVVAQSGGLQEFDFVWPRAMKALAGLNTLRLSQFTEAELSAALESAGPSFRERMGTHTDHIVPWADSFWRVCKIYGSFRQYLRSFDSEGPETLVADLNDRLVGLTPEFLTSYLKSAGEKLQAPQTEADLNNNRRRSQESSGNNRRGRDGGRRRGRGQQSRPQAQQQQPTNRPPAEKPTAQAPSPAPASAPGTATEGDKQQKPQGGGRRRGKRGFFRRRRGGRAPKSGESGGSAPAQGQNG